MNDVYEDTGLQTGLLVVMLGEWSGGLDNGPEVVDLNPFWASQQLKNTHKPSCKWIPLLNPGRGKGSEGRGTDSMPKK